MVEQCRDLVQLQRARRGAFDQLEQRPELFFRGVGRSSSFSPATSRLASPRYLLV
jgi:hypothetical protein